jgi:hypothetical protein
MASNSEVNNRHAAGFLLGKEIYGVSVNKFIFPTTLINGKKFYNTRHAEVSIFEKLKMCDKKKISGLVDILVIRVNKNGDLKNSRPCNKCIKTMKSIVRKVFYSTDFGNIVSENLDDMKLIHVSSADRQLEKNKN